jgi:GrpB-like predicted nucleotidyltransferase (UPF0157 family)
LEQYDPEWPGMFEREAALIRAALGDSAIRVEHIGSTAVPGLAAKPVIDMLVAVRSFDPADAYAEPLERLGYEYGAEEEPDHRFFKKALDERRAVHIHVMVEGGEWDMRHRAFRDHLRADPAEARRYEAVKREMAARHPLDRDAYAESKTPYIRSVEARLRAERFGPFAEESS